MPLKSESLSFFPIPSSFRLTFDPLHRLFPVSYFRSCFPAHRVYAHTHSHLLLPLFFLLTGDRDSGIRFGGACGFRERGESETAIRESGARPVHRKPDVSIKRVPVHHICRQKGQKMRGKRNYSPPLIMLIRDVEYVIPLLISNTMVTKKMIH